MNIHTLFYYWFVCLIAINSHTTKTFAQAHQPNITYNQNAVVTLWGTIGDEPTRMNIKVNDGKVSGIYFLVKQQKAIRISGKLTTYANNLSTFELQSYDNKEQPTTITHFMNGHISQQTNGEYVWQGTRIGTDGSTAEAMRLIAFNRYYLHKEHRNNGQQLLQHSFSLITKKGTESFVSEEVCHEIKIEYPEIDGMTNDSLEKKINTLLIQQNDSESRLNGYRSINQYYSDCQVVLDETQYEVHDKIHQQTYTVHCFDDKFLSVEYNVSEYLGGAHDHEHTDYLTINLSNANILTIDSLFKADSDYLSFLAIYCLTALNEQIDLKLNSETTYEIIQSVTQPKRENFEHFYLTEKELVIVFPYYKLNRTWVNRADELVFIPLDKLIPYLK